MAEELPAAADGLRTALKRCERPSGTCAGPGEGDHVPPSIRSLRIPLVALAGVATALGVAGLTAAPSGSQTVPKSTTATTATATTKTTQTTETQTTQAVAPPKKVAPKPVKRTITCKAKLVAAKPPLATAENFGTVSCSTPFGKGVQHENASVAQTGDDTGSFGGPVKLFFNTGTLRGTQKLTFTITGGTIAYKGTMKISSGTGEFRKASGSGTVTGTSSDGARTATTTKLTLTITPPA